MPDGQTCDTRIQEDRKLFFQCDESGVSIAHVAKLRKEELEYMEVDTKFAMDPLGMTPD